MVTQPILTQYLCGRQVSCPIWMTLMVVPAPWGEPTGYSPLSILSPFTTGSAASSTLARSRISAFLPSWPGLCSDSWFHPGDKVAAAAGAVGCHRFSSTLQSARVAADGFYGPATAAAVSEFQSNFRGCPSQVVVDSATGIKISHIYVGIYMDRGS